MRTLIILILASPAVCGSAAGSVVVAAAINLSDPLAVTI